MTSNAGSTTRSSALGFNRTADEAERSHVMAALGEFLRPEFLGRVDEIVLFRQLTEENYAVIAGLMLDEIKTSMDEKGILFGYDEEAARVIAKKILWGQERRPGYSAGPSAGRWRTRLPSSWWSGRTSLRRC